MDEDDEEIRRRKKIVGNDSLKFDKNDIKVNSFKFGGVIRQIERRFNEK